MKMMEKMIKWKQNVKNAQNIISFFLWIKSDYHELNVIIERYHQGYVPSLQILSRYSWRWNYQNFQKRSKDYWTSFKDQERKAKKRVNKKKMQQTRAMNGDQRDRTRF